MRQRFPILLLLCCGLGVWQPGLTSAQDRIPPALATIDQVHRGMQGVGKTVFQGTRIDSFTVDILGVMQDYLGPGQDIILARLGGDPLDESGVIAGMSGSPVYIDGRLIGAVALGWNSTKTPVCGIMPIHQMLQVMNRRLDAPASDEVLWGMQSPAPLQNLPAAGPLPYTAAMQPLRTPIWGAGLMPQARHFLEQELAPLGLEMVAGPGTQTTTDTAPPFEAGAAMGVQLLRGDLGLTSIGTLTYIDGERALGWGHSLFMAGASELPMTGAYIYDVIPSQFQSFKLGAATRTLGTVRQDRLAAIAGVVGPVPSMLPVSVNIHGETGEQRFTFEVLRHRNLTPTLVRLVLMNTLEATEKLFGDATLKLHTRITMQKGEDLELQQVFSGQTALIAAALHTGRDLATLTQSPYKELKPTELTFSLVIDEKIKSARIVDVRLVPPSLEPGDQAVAHVTLLRHDGTTLTHRMPLVIPSNLAPGPAILRFGGSSASQAWEAQRRPDLLKPRTAQQIRARLISRPNATHLFMELHRIEIGIAVAGRELPGLPPTALAILQGERSAGRLESVHGRVIHRHYLETEYVLSGEKTLELNIGKL